MVFSLLLWERGSDRINLDQKKTGIKPVFIISHHQNW